MMRADHRQFDMFAGFAPTPVPVDVAPLPAIVLTGDRRADDDALREQLRTARDEAEAAGAIETIAWGSGLKANKTGDFWFSMPHGKPGVIIKLWQVEPGRWITALSTSHINGGGLSGFWHGDKGHATREAALIAVMRGRLRTCARAQSMRDWGDAEHAREGKAAEEQADWAISMCPPLVYGVDLADEYARMVEAEVEEEQRRRAMLRQVSDLQQVAHDALYDEGEYTGGPSWDRTIVNNNIPEGSAWQARFVGKYHVTGTMPDRLEIVVYSDRHDEKIEGDDAVLARALARIAPAVDVPVRMATEAEYELCHADRGKVTW